MSGGILGQRICAFKFFVVIIKMPFQMVVVLYTSTNKDYFKNLVTCNTLWNMSQDKYISTNLKTLQGETSQSTPKNIWKMGGGEEMFSANEWHRLW